MSVNGGFNSLGIRPVEDINLVVGRRCCKYSFILNSYYCCHSYWLYYYCYEQLQYFQCFSTKLLLLWLYLN